MMSIFFDDIAFNDGNSRNAQRYDDTLENQDGSTMFIAKYTTIEIEEGQVTNKPYVQELLHALKLSWPFLLVVIVAIYGFYQFTQNRIDASRTAIDAQLTEIRTQMSADRQSASADNVALRGDMTQGFNRIADKLDDINKTLTSIQVEQATEKAKSEKP